MFPVSINYAVPDANVMFKRHWSGSISNMPFKLYSFSINVSYASRSSISSLYKVCVISGESSGNKNIANSSWLSISFWSLSTLRNLRPVAFTKLGSFWKYERIRLKVWKILHFTSASLLNHTTPPFWDCYIKQMFRLFFRCLFLIITYLKNDDKW